MGRRMVLYVVLVLFLSIVQPSHNHIVSLLPNDPIVEEEDDLVLTCTFSCSSCVPVFTYGNNVQLPTHVQNLTGNILQLRMKVNMTFNNVTFYCDDNVTTPEGQRLQVVEAPKNVSTWSALVTPETLYVNWTLNNDPDSVNVSTYWSPDDDDGNTRNNCSNSSKEFCLLKEWDFQDSPEYFLTINVTNRLNNSTVTYIPIKTETFVKPEPVESLKSTVLTSTSVNLEWTYMYHFDGLEFVIECKHDTHNYTRTTKSKNVSFGDLKPFTNYSCCVHVNLSSSIYISETKCLVVPTLEDKPTKGPNIRGYSVDRCRGENRTVYIYVEAPDKEDRNGILNECGLMAVSNSTSIISSCSPYSKTINQTLQGNETFNISIIMSTSGGSSPSAFLRVLKQNVSGSSGRPMMSSGLLLLRDRVMMYCASCANWSMHWCKGSNFNCTNPLQEHIVGGSNWSAVPVNRTDVQDILIGSSSKLPSKSSEIFWTNCVLDLTKDKISLKLESEKINFLKVRWFLPGFDCSVGSIIGSFLVEYCSNICVNRTTDSTEREMSISNLEGQVAYRVRVTYVTVDGRTGQWSDQGVQTVKGVDWKQWVAIVGGCLIVPIVVIAIFVFRLIRTKLSHRFDIVTPDIPPSVDDSSQLNSSSGSGGVTDLTESSPLVSETEKHWTSSPSTARAAGSVGKHVVSNGSAVDEYSDYSKFHIKGASSGEDEAILMDSIQPKVILCGQTEIPRDEEQDEDTERGDFTGDSSVCPYIIAGSDMT